MPILSIYDPAQCCATGACSPDADDQLAQFASALEWLKQQGIEVTRYNLGHQPGAFVQNPAVKSALDSDGVACLPLIIADGRVISKGRYPSRAELGNQLGLSAGTACCAGTNAAPAARS